MRPEVFLGISHDSAANWDERDRGLARALAVHEGTQNGYGIPYKQAHDPDTEGWWQVRFIEDYAAKAVRDAREKESPPSDAMPVVTLDPDYRPRSASAND